MITKHRGFIAMLARLLIAVVCCTVCSVSGYCDPDIEYYDVLVGSQKVFDVANTKLKSAAERGEEINDRIKRIVADPQTDTSKLQVREGLDGVPVIMLGSLIVCEVTANDATASGENATSLANEWLTKLHTRIDAERKVRTQESANAASAPGAAKGGEHKKLAASQNESSTLSEHAILLLFLEIAILLFSSLAIGELMVRLGQPAIIGQILAGLLLGQSVFGNFFPDWSVLVFPQDNLQSKLISVLSWVGVSFILMLTGMETDTSMLKRLGKPAAYLAIIGAPPWQCDPFLLPTP